MTSAAKRPVVLIVEDELLLRINAAEMIAESGFDVVEAGNADEAIAILEARPEIHIVFTDIQMPGSLDGLKLARFVRGRWPAIKIVATSGRVALCDADLPEGGVFIGKPYTAAEISATLRDLAGLA
jgi:CheY-like chemotaxis protein